MRHSLWVWEGDTENGAKGNIRLVDTALLYLMGRNWPSEGWGAKRWRGAWGYSERERER